MKLTFSSVIFLLAAVQLLLVLADDPKVEIKPTDPPLHPVEGIIIQQKDKDVQLTCNVENKPHDSEVQWTVQPKGSSEAVIISTATRSLDAFRWAIDNPTPTGWRLRIQNAQVPDEGRYTCQVQLHTQSYEKDSRVLKIVQSPQISDLYTSSDMTKKTGEEARFDCYATGRPKPIVKWVRLAGELLPNGGTEFQGNEFIIPDVRASSAGVYKCIAINSAGSVERRVRLTVKFQPEVYVGKPIVRQAPGYVKELVCNIKGYPQPNAKQITWRTSNGPPITNEGRFEIRNIPGAYHRTTSILVINGVQEEDYDKYRCEATNEISGIDPSYSVIELMRSQVPTPTRNGQIRSAASALSFSLATVIMLLSVCLLQREHH